MPSNRTPLLPTTISPVPIRTLSGLALATLSIFAFCIAAWFPNVAQADDKVDFNRDIRPILRAHCTGCHGGVKAAGGISFVHNKSAFVEGDSGEAAIQPGRSNASELVRRISAGDEERMPPPEHGRGLNADEIEKIRKWIDQGAQWAEVWSLTPVVAPAEPKVSNPDWCRVPLDAFVLAKLDSLAMRPSAEASPAQWLRRVTLDLTGLPPSLDDYQAFLARTKQSTAKAKEEVVDRLLDSSAYGERWASMWLDLARYSDTFGFEKDPERTIWPWRDWVIKAFNSDMPFDEFTRKQIAGDLLPNRTLSDVLATAFHRNTQCNTEGGTDDEEFRYAAVADRVNTVWTTWHASTFGCVRCHSHPYDPYLNEDYYRFIAYFDNTEDCDQNDDFPRIGIPSNDQVDILRVRDQLDGYKRERNELGSELVQQAAWQRAVPATVSASVGDVTSDPQGEITTSGALAVGVVTKVQLKDVAGTSAIRVTIKPQSDKPIFLAERGQVISHVTVRASTPKLEKSPNIEDVDKAGIDWVDVPIRTVVAEVLEGPFEVLSALDKDAAGIGPYPVTTEPRSYVLVLERPVPADATEVEVSLKQSATSNSGFQGCFLRRFALDTTTSNSISQWSESERLRVLDAQIKQLEKEYSEQAKIKVPVLVERSKPARRKTAFLSRGDRTQPDHFVEPGVPSILLAPDQAQPKDRLELADWLCSPQNPLTSRTLVNRLWSELFGVGLVETVEDLGTSGTEPSHPELLDFLADQMVHKHRWSIKSMLKEIVLSSTYGQTSSARDELIEKDRFNRWLARGPRARMTAEMIRDHALHVSGLISKKQFGPPVFPPQPDGIWKSVYNERAWETSTGEDRYRRALYTYQKRTSSYPALLAFDAPSRDLCNPRRLTTNTPLQALTTLNDPAFVEMATAFAARMTAISGKSGDTNAEALSTYPTDEVRKQIEYGCQLITLDAPPAEMLSRLTQLYEQAYSEYSEHPELLTETHATPHMAALTLVANAIFNLDTFLVR